LPALNVISAVLLVAGTAVYDLTTGSASVPRWIIAYLWASLICISFLVAFVRSNWFDFDRIDGLAVLSFLWAAFTLLWSKDWLEGVMQLTNLAALLAVFMWVRRFPDRIPDAAALCVTVALIMQLVWPLDWGGQGNRNFQTELILCGLCVSTFARGPICYFIILVLFPVSIWYLIFYNPSKIEFIVGAALISWAIIGSAIRRKLDARARRNLAQQLSRVA
jgi:hypothetical protein